MDGDGILNGSKIKVRITKTARMAGPQVRRISEKVDFFLGTPVEGGFTFEDLFDSSDT